MGSCQWPSNCIVQLRKAQFRGYKLCVNKCLTVVFVTALALLGASIYTLRSDPRDRKEVTNLMLALLMTIIFTAFVNFSTCCYNKSTSKVPGQMATPVVVFSSEEAPRRRTLEMPRHPRIIYEANSEGSSPRLGIVRSSTDENIMRTKIHLVRSSLENNTWASALTSESGEEHTKCSLQDVLEELYAKNKSLVEALGLSSSTDGDISVDESAQTSRGTTEAFDDETEWQSDLLPQYRKQLRRKTVQSRRFRYTKASKSLDSGSVASQHSESTQSTVCTDTGGTLGESKAESSYSSGSQRETTFSSKVAPFVKAKLKSTDRTQSSTEVQLVKVRDRSHERETHVKTSEDTKCFVSQTLPETTTTGPNMPQPLNGRKGTQFRQKKNLGQPEDSKDRL